MVRVLALMVALLLALAGPAAAQQRHALVVGIGSYPGLATASEPDRGRLPKAAGDARAVAEALRGIGFAVALVEDGTRRRISEAVDALEQAIRPGDAVFLYFAGYGLEIDGANWLLPSDFPPSVDAGGRPLSLRAVRDAALNAGELLASLRGAGARPVIGVLDASRDFGGSGAPGPRGVGLAQMPAPEGVFVLLSAGARQVALDRLGDADSDPNSVFARVLLPLLAEPGLTIDALARRVRSRVAELAASVGQAQLLSYYDGLTQPFVLVPAGAPAPAQRAVVVVPREPAPAQAPPDQAEPESLRWKRLETSEDVAELERFAQGVTDPALRMMVQGRIIDLRQRLTVRDGAPRPVAPLPPAPVPLPALPPVAAVPPPLPLPPPVALPGPGERTAPLAPETLAIVPPVAPVLPVAPGGSSPPPAVEAPSFDCNRASGVIETTICARPELARLDRELAALYQQALASPNGARVRREQVAWIGARNSACARLFDAEAIAACIERLYARRIGELSGTATIDEAPARAPIQPSFSCAKARGAIETAICADATLAGLDRELASLYRRAAGGPGVASAQRAWLASRDACARLGGSLADCIAAAYRRRISQLR